MKEKDSGKDKESKTKGKVLKKAVVWKDLYFYRKSDALYQITVEFCKRFLPAHGDRTVDQMVQAARSGKQNIVEGSEDGQTSSEMEIKLMNVARGSLQELRADYQDYLNTHRLVVWDSDSERQRRLRDFCHSHNDYIDYEPLLPKMNDEEMANLALTLCHQADKMMCSYIEMLEERFVTEGGIKERMYAARTGYRQEQDAHMRALEQENAALKNKVKELEAELAALGEPRKKKKNNMETQILNLQAPFDYIHCNGEVGKHIATYIVGESRIDEEGKYTLETHSHPIVQYQNSPKGVVWNRAELTDCEVLCSEDDMRIDIRTFFLLCIQRADQKAKEAGKDEFGFAVWGNPADEAEPLKEKLRQHGIGFKSKGKVVEVGVEVGKCSDGYFAQFVELSIMDFHYIEPTLEELGKRLTEEREYWEEFYDHVVKIKYTPDSSTAEGFVENL